MDIVLVVKGVPNMDSLGNTLEYIAGEFRPDLKLPRGAWGYHITDATGSGNFTSVQINEYDGE